MGCHGISNSRKKKVWHTQENLSQMMQMNKNVFFRVKYVSEQTSKWTKDTNMPWPETNWLLSKNSHLLY